MDGTRRDPHNPAVGWVRLGFAVSLAAALAACFGDGEVKGGDATADVSKTETGTSDGGPTDGACNAPDAATWTQLYTDYFGPTGKGQCGKASGCHLDSTGGGQIWICGSTKESCYQGMKNNVIPCNAAGSRMPEILRKANDPFAPGKMPADPASVTYDDQDIAKISGWINAGAKND